MVKTLNQKELYYSIFFLLDRYCEFNKEKLKNSLFPGLVSSMDPFILQTINLQILHLTESTQRVMHLHLVKEL